MESKKEFFFLKKTKLMDTETVLWSPEAGVEGNCFCSCFCFLNLNIFNLKKLEWQLSLGYYIGKGQKGT